jgi:hypothetical protein
MPSQAIGCSPLTCPSASRSPGTEHAGTPADDDIAACRRRAHTRRDPSAGCTATNRSMGPGRRRGRPGPRAGGGALRVGHEPQRGDYGSGPWRGTVAEPGPGRWSAGSGRPAAAPRQRRRHRRRLLPHARSPSQGRNHLEEELINPRGGDFYLATSGDRNLTIDKSHVTQGHWERPDDSPATATATGSPRRPGGRAHERGQKGRRGAAPACRVAATKGGRWGFTTEHQM